jgi:hypothetical protein
MSRLGSGASIRTAAAAVGMSETMFGRIERGQLRNVTVVQLATACSAVGLKLAGRPWPDGGGVRDAAHARLLQRLRSELPPGTPWRTEVGLPIAGDRRAWDAQFELEQVVVGIEAEVRLVDLQALERRISLKRRDSGIGLVILLVAKTSANRRHLADHRGTLRASFPLDTRAILRAIRASHPPPAGGIVVL